jgi:ArsR family transcriptional regulator, arsenate/arsenite/antimonite-responsive transcriptional repressor / arsenate reductase (thioredoxin)
MAESQAKELAPPAFLQLAAHPLRWQLLGELARSDLMVHELTDRVGQPQNLVSYHLAKLRDGRLVSARRSSADGRDAYYMVDIARFGALLTATGAALHPGLRLTPAVPPTGRATATSGRVLFLCTGNSARSQIAEALIEHMSGGTVKASSAGSHPKSLHPNAVKVMRKRGIDISGNRTKHLDEFRSQRFDRVITLCDRVREICPEFPSHPELVHWSVPDPAQEGPTDRASYPAFERTAVELETRIHFLIPLLAEQATTKQQQQQKKKKKGVPHVEH